MTTMPAAWPAPWCLRLASVAAVMGEGTVDWSQLRVTCERAVAQLQRDVGIPDPWDMNVFLDRLEASRGRPIDLCAVAWTPGQSSGAWRARADYDVIAYTSNTTSVHQDAIILHEVGHMIREHRGRCILSDEKAQRIGPELAPATFAHMLKRTTSAQEEHEAELIAHLVLARIARQRPRRRGGEFARRVEGIFG
ncbi:hypothetical protein [Amycolatopsis sp. A1MSW2902]|uniref:hypothetical protein n=1 Tax=Amycolatopsis sp. A1MSW2902 TaxID=687413 RepID=UPI00307D169C